MERRTQGAGRTLRLVAAGLVAPRVPRTSAQEAVVVLYASGGSCGHF